MVNFNKNTLKPLIESMGLSRVITALLGICVHFLGLLSLHLPHGLCLVNICGIIDLTGFLMLLRGSKWVCRQAPLSFGPQINDILFQGRFMFPARVETLEDRRSMCRTEKPERYLLLRGEEAESESLLSY